MDIQSLMSSAANRAAKAAGVARLPRAASDVTAAVDYADAATSLVKKATGMLSSGTPLAGATAAAVRQASGIITLASTDLAGAGNALLSAAGGRLASANGMLKQALGKSLTAFSGLPSGAQSAISGLLKGGGVSSLVQSVGSLPFGQNLATGGGRGYLLELAPDATMGAPFRFELGKAAYDAFSRETQFNIASQDRLTRRPAEQAVGKGSDRITLKGAIFLARHGAGHIDRLRALGEALQPLIVTTGYGEHMGRWYLARLSEEQEHLFTDGAPRKQSFTLELTRYGDDYQNL
ncbi:MAG: phage tail protein [Pseudogulbenkiania sp.]|nr:phage tail protein [Pseudogulbenkiania sp.]